MADFAFGEAVRRVRIARGLTQAELAKRANVSRSQLARIEGGLEPGSASRQHLTGAFGFVYPYQLFAATGDPASVKYAEEMRASTIHLERVAAKRDRTSARAPMSAPSRAQAPVRTAPRYADQYWRGEPRPKRPSAAARGYGKAHRQMRAFILARDPWCVPGYPRGVHGTELVPSTVADHILSLRRGGTTTPGNMVGRCRACNARKAIAEEGAGYQSRGRAQRQRL